ncbi:MAG: hypothetical protein II399_00380, partial [Lachnospiraceae bacterium]|nr:hypothetical protein [Lachnospiraceae bacterium]
GDEGHSFRAEITFMDTDGWEWWEKDMNAFMEGHVISTTYKTITGCAATCASEGLKDHKVCTSCGKKFINNKEVSDVTIPKTGHVYDNSCDAVCNVCGYTREASHKWSSEYVYSSDGHRHKCTVCGALSPIIPHVLTSTLMKSGDCEHESTYKYQCECGYSYEENVAATGHKWLHADAVEALCINTGFAEHYYCENCYAMSTDKEGKNRVGIKKLEMPFDPNNHIGGMDIGYNAEQHYTICQCGAHIEAAAHTFNDKGRCTVCGYKKDSVIKTSVSNLTKHERIEATCVSEGIKEHYTDEKGNAYLSPAGVKIVPHDQLIIPVNPENHAGHNENDFTVTDRQHSKLGHDAYRHFILCECHVQLSSEEHQFGEDNICSVCGYKKGDIIVDTVPVTPDNTSEITPDTIPDTSPEQGTGEVIEEKGGFPFWIIIVIVVVIIIIIIIIAAALSKKKRK